MTDKTRLFIALVASDNNIPVKLVVKSNLLDMIRFLENDIHPSECLLDSIIIHSCLRNMTSSYTIKQFFANFVSYV